MPNDSVSLLSDDELVELAERVERLCREHSRDGQLRGLLEEDGAEALLDEAMALVTAADFTPARMREVLDEIERVLAAQGVHGLTRPNREWTPLPGVRPQEAAVTARICPLGRCTRAAVGAERCALGGRDLEPVPLT